MSLLLISEKKATISATVNSRERSFTTQFCTHCTLGSRDEWREDDTEHDLASSTTVASAEVMFWLENADVATQVALGRVLASAILIISPLSSEDLPRSCYLYLWSNMYLDID